MKKTIKIKKMIIIILSIIIQSPLFSWYGFLPDDMKLSDAICIAAHHAEALDTRGWNIPVQYGTFYDLMAKHGARSLDIRLHLGTNEEAVFESTAKDVGNFFTNLFSGKDVTKPRQKDIAFIGCHEHDKYGDNCWFTRLIEKRGKPDAFQVFLNDIKKFLDNNPEESLFVGVGSYIHQGWATEINGWKGKKNQDIAHFFDNLVRDAGLLPRTFTKKITANTTVGDIRGKVTFFTNLDGVVAYSSTLSLPVQSQANSWDLVGKKCTLSNYNPNAIFTSIGLHPENPFDTSIDQGVIKKILNLVPDFLAENKRGEKLIWNYATEVNTVENIFGAAHCCNPSSKVNFINFNFLSRYAGRKPFEIIYEINHDRMSSINEALAKLSRTTGGPNVLNKMLYDPTGGFSNYLQKIK